MFNYKVFVAELLGTFVLVFVGAAVGLYNAGLLAVALAHGLTLAVMVYAFGHISGAHVNPAVTFGLALNGTVKWSEAVVYWIAQFAGAVLAAFALSAFVGVVNAEAFAATSQTTGVLTTDFPYYAFALEALLTFFLVNTVLHTTLDGKAGPLSGWAIGTTYAVAILAGGPLTGASLNPARTFGPAAVSGAARNGMLYLIYFAGPILGAAVAVGIYKLLNAPDMVDDVDLDPALDVVEAQVEEVEEETVDEEAAPKQPVRKARKVAKKS
jgi:MIP family channel proteins